MKFGAPISPCWQMNDGEELLEAIRFTMQLTRRSGFEASVSSRTVRSWSSN